MNKSLRHLLTVSLATGTLVGCEIRYAARTPTISTFTGSSIPEPVPPTNAQVGQPRPAPVVGVPTTPNAGAAQPSATAVSQPASTPPATQAQSQGSIPVIRGTGLFGGDQPVPGSLRGIVYFIPEGTRQFPDVSKLPPAGVVYASELNVPSRDFNDGFPGIDNRFEWFAIRYEGYFVVSKPDTYKFTLASDDGSYLYIDDKPVINNDGVHPIQSRVGDVTLSGGTHKIRVDYWQGPRYQVALQLWVQSATMAQKPWNASM